MTVEENASSNNETVMNESNPTEVKPIDQADIQEESIVAQVDSVENIIDATEQVTEKPAESQEAIPSIETLTQELAQATKKAAENWELLLRQKAENANLQRRVERDIEKAHKFGLEKFVLELLPIKDSMELGLEAASKPDTSLETICEGMELTLQMFRSALEKFNIAEVYPQDQKFDPHLHEAMSMQPIPNVEDGTVIYVHQKGYQLNERLLRPARVVIAKTPES